VITQPESARITVAYRGTLDGITEMMGDAVRMVSEISVASSQQTEAMNDIGAHIVQLAMMTEQNVSVVQRTTTLMSYLGKMLGRVHHAVSRYEA